ncbi:metallophosphoesterase [Methanolobus sp. WCC5]|uniref:metallophosphoesterase n=1 Tax=Methanolobus sp. WCC5 TaxID=3125785 RepID=UPI00324DEE4D
MSQTELDLLLQETTGIFRKEPALIRVRSTNAMIVGDIHGNLMALDFLVQVQREMNSTSILFLGDYVDRGRNSVAVLSRLLELKLKGPQTVILLRGNHETPEMNRAYGFYEELNDEELFVASNYAFQQMPVAAVVNDTVFCVHGGIPGPVDIERIGKEDSFPYLWNDPSDLKGMTPSLRGIRPECFGPDVFNDFMALNHLSMMMRAHTAYYKGYTWWFNDRLLSLFSSPDYAGRKNVGAFAILKEDKVSVFIFGRKGKNSYGIINGNQERDE